MPDPDDNSDDEQVRWRWDSASDQLVTDRRSKEDREADGVDGCFFFVALS